MTKTPHSIEPSRDLYQKVRGGFIAQGTTLTEWCRKEGLRPENARSCLFGDWDGPKARDWRARLVAAAGLSQRPAA